jgi:hypothetical protein
MAGHIQLPDETELFSYAEVQSGELFDSDYDGLCEAGEAAAEEVKNPAHDIANLLSVIVAICESLHEDVCEPRQAELARTGMIAAEKAAIVRSVPARRANPRPRLSGASLPPLWLRPKRPLRCSWSTTTRACSA